MKYQFYQAIWVTLDWLFPPECAGCGKLGSRLCPECEQRTPRMALDTCSVCSKKFHKSSFHSCQRLEWLDEAFAWGLYRDPLGRAIRRLKYSRDIALGDTLSRLLFAVCRERELRPDLVVPVPLARNRQKERGYNQAALLARPLAWKLGFTYAPRLVRRIRETASQVGLTIEQRKENMNGAFIAQNHLPTGKHILIIDDVLTTGATLDAVAKALKASGASSVTGLVLARA